MRTISQSRFDIIFGKYIYYFSGIIWIIILFWETCWYGSSGFINLNLKFPAFSLQFALPILLVSHLLLYMALYKFAYRVDFDFTTKSLRFYFFRNKQVIEKPLNDLKLIYINWHVYFIFNNGGKIWFKGTSEFFELIRDFKLQRKWGPISKVLLKKEYSEDLESGGHTSNNN